MSTEATLWEFAISLVLVFSCKPVKDESESRNFSEERSLQMAIQSSLFQFSCKRTRKHSQTENHTDWLVHL